jgi:phage tail-like protein
MESSQLMGVSGWLPALQGELTTSEIVEHKIVEGGVEKFVKAPGRYLYGEIVFERALSTDTQLYDWRQMVIAGATEARTDVKLIRTGEQGPLLQLDLQSAWPSGYEILAYPNGAMSERLSITADAILVQ